MLGRDNLSHNHLGSLDRVDTSVGLSGGATLGPTRSRVPRRFLKKKFKVDFYIDKSKSVKLILKSFDDKYSFVLVILSYFLFYLIF